MNSRTTIIQAIDASIQKLKSQIHTRRLLEPPKFRSHDFNEEEWDYIVKTATVEEAVKEAPATTRHPSVDETTAKKAVGKLGKDEEEATVNEESVVKSVNETTAKKAVDKLGKEEEEATVNEESVVKSNNEAVKGAPATTGHPNVDLSYAETYNTGLPPMETPDIGATPAENLRTKTPKTASSRKTPKLKKSIKKTATPKSVVKRLGTIPKSDKKVIKEKLS